VSGHLYVYAPADAEPVVLGTYDMGKSAKHDAPDATCMLHATGDPARAQAWHASLLAGEEPDLRGRQVQYLSASSKPPLLAATQHGPVSRPALSLCELETS
jgi:hypothetical protein